MRFGHLHSNLVLVLVCRLEIHMDMHRGNGYFIFYIYDIRFSIGLGKNKYNRKKGGKINFGKRVKVNIKWIIFKKTMNNFYHTHHMTNLD